MCITGTAGAGKSTVGRVLKRRGYSVYELGDIVRQLMHEAGVRITPESNRAFSERLRRRYGDVVTPRLLLGRISVRRNENMAIVGIRSRKELDYIKKRLGSRERIVTVAVVAPAKTRYERTRKRNRPDAPKSLAAFVRDTDRKEERWGVRGAIASADYIISGAGSLGELKRDAGMLFSAIESGKEKAF